MYKSVIMVMLLFFVTINQAVHANYHIFQWEQKGLQAMKRNTELYIFW